MNLREMPRVILLLIGQGRFEDCLALFIYLIVLLIHVEDWAVLIVL